MADPTDVFLAEPHIPAQVMTGPGVVLLDNDWRATVWDIENPAAMLTAAREGPDTVLVAMSDPTGDGRVVRISCEVARWYGQKLLDIAQGGEPKETTL